MFNVDIKCFHAEISQPVKALAIPSRCSALSPSLEQGVPSFFRPLHLFDFHTCHPTPVIISVLIKPWFFTHSSSTPYLPAIQPVSHLTANLSVVLLACHPSLPVQLLISQIGTQLEFLSFHLTQAVPGAPPSSLPLQPLWLYLLLSPGSNTPLHQSPMQVI